MFAQHTFQAMGSQMLALLEGSGPEAERRLASIPLCFAYWQRVLSRFDNDSELMRLQRSADTPTTISRVLWDVLDLALWAYDYSDGLIDAAVLPDLERAGYAQSWELGSATRATAPASQSISALRREWQSQTVALPAGLRLDLGGVAKGWAAQQAARILGTAGPALIDAGGDIAVCGVPAGSAGWLIEIADPHNPAADLLSIQVREGGVATSGRDVRRWQRDGVWQHHIIDPRTHQPAQTDVFSATVIGPTTVEAEVAAKTALIMGSEAGLAWIERQPDLAALLVLEDGAQRRSQRFEQFIAA